LNLREPLTATIDDRGRLLLPVEVTVGLGLQPGMTVTFDVDPDGLRLHRPVEALAKVYVEPTTRCNLTCRTCMRRAWEGALGDMSGETFARVLEGLQAFDPPPTVFFGGFGEPLAHPRIVEMVAAVKAAGAPAVELITNGCLLHREMSVGLMEAGLDTLWVSLDGITPESYSDVRLGALLPHVLDNLRTFKMVRRERQLPTLTAEQRRRFEAGVPGWHDSWRLPDPSPALGVVFVAMRRNIADLPGVIAETYRMGARRFIVSNVLPYTPELAKEMLCLDRLAVSPFPTLWDDRLRLPQMDIDETTRAALHAAVHSYETGLAEHDVSAVTRWCPFAEGGTTSITWNGEVAPCLALMHGHDEIFDGRTTRRVEAHSFGSLGETSLREIWWSPDYHAFRQRVQAFDFGPCLVCKRCSLPDGNQEDCVHETAPVCGACLWSQGVIQCP
jgi:MoaA/NifB/PqqE/SkfB family radical SAM enzyme